MNLKCDCIRCKYEIQKPTEDPCYRCIHSSEYVPSNWYETTRELDFENVEPNPETEPVEEY